jgi:protein SCO1/2
MHEVASNVDKIDLVPGVDYDLVTVSFDDRETPELARTAKKNLLDEMETKVPPDSWRFLTGEADDIARLADAVGFRFKRDKQDFVHAATVIFLTKDGKIVRYLGGLKLLPADLELAILDAARGTPRTLMQRIQQLCYAFDPAGKTYVLQVNRIILAVSLGGLGIFLAFLLLFRRKRPEAETPGEVGEPTTERSS